MVLPHISPTPRIRLFDRRHFRKLITSLEKNKKQTHFHGFFPDFLSAPSCHVRIDPIAGKKIFIISHPKVSIAFWRLHNSMGNDANLQPPETRKLGEIPRDAKLDFKHLSVSEALGNL